MPPRSTRVHSIARDDPDPRFIAEAAEVLRRGGLVAFATETVYGLGADATNPEAVAGIFAAKGRPAANPLIVHVADVAMAGSCVADWPDIAEALAERFWPGPLTLVLARSAIIPDVVTGGLDTVGLRVPEPLVARTLIGELGRPLAAPSANRSNGISPTLAEHVREDLEGRIDLILDSGPTTVGIESTVLDLTTREPRILRPGPISGAEISAALDGLRVRDAEHSGSGTGDRPMSPGQLAVHYAPKTRAIRVESFQALDDFPWPDRAALIVFGAEPIPPLPPGLEIIRFASPDVAARGLYATLRQCDDHRLDLIVVVPPAHLPDWEAIRDRLRRATTPWESIS